MRVGVWHNGGRVCGFVVPSHPALPGSIRVPNAVPHTVVVPHPTSPE